MPAKRELSMRQLRHLLRLHHGGVSAREIGRRLGVARSTVQDNPKRASTPEAEAAERFLAAMGVPSGRTTFEARSRNTSENAMLTRDLVSPKPGERWLLVTSAFHMPRAMGAFRHAGFDVIAWPSRGRPTT